MEAAKSAISEHLHHAGKQHTEVDEHVNPAITSETVKPHRHEEITQAVDREVHQHHYHTTVQPLAHTETLPEQHTHNLVPAVQKEFHHGDHEEDKTRLAAEAALFKDNTTTRETTHSATKAPTLVGEHVHHHVHEVVQPVIHKETIQPEVVHTTVPVHEVHTSAAQHHGISTLPMKSLADFETGGGKLSGGTHAHETYEGQPRSYNPELQNVQYSGAGVASSHQGVHDGNTSLKRDIHTRDSGVSGVDNSSHGAAAAAGVGAGAAAATATASHGAGSDHHAGQPASHENAAASSGTAQTVHSEGQNLSSGVPAAEASHSNVKSEAVDKGVSETATTESKQTPERSEAETRPSEMVREDEPKNLVGGKAEHGADKDLDSDVQHASQGDDPNLVREKSNKLTGEGTDGSHSAVFGLTPDGHKFEDTKNHGGSGVPAQTEESKTESKEKDNETDKKEEVSAS